MPPEPTTSLERFVPRVASEWERDAGKALHQERDATLCFVDISGFTALSERLALRGRIGVEELTEVLNRVFGAMLDIAFARSGSLLKFGGDALLLMFEGPDHAAQGAAAAVEMRASLRSATEEPMSIGRVRLRMSVGLHAGPVLLFRPGSLHRELIVTGPGATRTTQMEHAASAGQIFVSPEMAGRLPAGATRPGPAGASVLRWRRSPVPPVGVQPRLAVAAEAVEACVPASLRAHLRSGDVEFEHRLAALAFLRFRGVDALLADQGPGAVAAALDELVGVVQRAAERLDVTFLASDIDEDGGKIILVSGVPTAPPDHAGRLLRAVREIVDAKPSLSMQIGVNHGHVFAGTIGAAHRATFTVMGDAVNLAARLMASAPPGEVYASPAVLDRARPQFATAPVEPFYVKGKAKPVHAATVGEEIGTRVAVDELGPFVGRAAEVADLGSSLPGGSRAAGSVRTVVGDNGIGKSRLVAEVLSAAPDLSVVTFRGEPDGTSSPYRACRDAVRSLLGLERGSPAVMRSQLGAAVERVDPTLLPLAPLLGDLAHVDLPPTPEVAAIDPRFVPAHRARALVRLLDHLRPGATELLVEDAQWVDAASVGLLNELSGAVADRAHWAMLVARRAGPGGFEPEGPRLTLGPLSNREVVDLTNALVPMHLRPDEIDRLVQRAAGSPLVVKALARVVAAGGLDDLPDSLEAVMAGEIDAVSPFARQLLRYGAVLGRSFDQGVWDRLLAVDEAERDDVSTAELGRFLELDADGGARFRQAVIRDVAYRSLPYRRRRELHLRAGQLIEELRADDVEAAADRLSVHFHEGGDAERAWRYARMAGARAQAAYAHDDAAALYRRALDAARDLNSLDEVEQRDTWTALGDVLERAGRLDEALEAYRRASALARSSPIEHAGILLKRARARERSGAFVAALRELTSAERTVGDAPGTAAEAVRVAVATMRAVVHEGQEQPGRALAAAQRAAAAAEAADLPDQLAKAYSVMDWAHVFLGELDEAVHEPLVVDIHRSLGNAHQAAAALGNHGAVRFWLGYWGEAMDCYRQAHEAYVQTGDVVNAAIQQANLAELLINRGDLEAAREAVTQAARTHRAVGYVDGALFDEIQLGRLLLRDGAPHAAAAVLQQVVDEATDLGLVGTALEARVHLADCLLEQGDGHGALEALAVAEAAAGGEATLFEASMAAVRSRALLLVGDAEGARRVRTDGIAAARRVHLHYELGQLLVQDDDPAARAEGARLLADLGVVVEVPTG